MPELPEVETIRRQLCAAGLPGRRICSVHIDWPKTVNPPAPAYFAQQLTGRAIQEIDRIGKWLIFRLDGPSNLLVHLRMSGGFYVTLGRLEKGPYDRVILGMSGALNLHYRDPRKFGRWRLGSAPENLGPDALTIPLRLFRRQMEPRSKPIKAALLDQTLLAGVGNIYADEMLFAAGIHPDRKACSLRDEDWIALHRALRKVLSAAVRNGGTSLGGGRSNYRDLNGQSGGHRDRVKVYGRAGLPCPRCRTPLHKTRIAGRTTVYCPHCQP